MKRWCISVMSIMRCNAMARWCVCVDSAIMRWRWSDGVITMKRWCDMARTMIRWCDNAMTMVRCHDEAIERQHDGAIAMTWWCDSDDAMLHRAIISFLSRYCHRFTVAVFHFILTKLWLCQTYRSPHMFKIKINKGTAKLSIPSRNQLF